MGEAIPDADVHQKQRGNNFLRLNWEAGAARISR